MVIFLVRPSRVRLSRSARVGSCHRSRLMTIMWMVLFASRSPPRCS